MPGFSLSGWSARMEMSSLLTTSSSLSRWVRTPTPLLALPVPSDQLAGVDMGKLRGGIPAGKRLDRGLG